MNKILVPLTLVIVACALQPPPIESGFADFGQSKLYYEMAGELDMPGIHEITAMLVDANPNARLTTVPGVGHYVNLEAPAEFNELLVEYLEGL